MKESKKQPGRLWLEYIKLKDLEKWPRNPKLHDSANLHKSMRRHGYTDPVTIDERTGWLVGGMGRLEELETMQIAGAEPPKNILVDEGGDWSMPVIRGNEFASEAEAEAYIMTVNKLVESGGWDASLAALMVKEVKPIGFDVIKEAQAVVAKATKKYEIDKPQFKSPEIQVPQPKTEVETPVIAFDDISGELQAVWEMDVNILFSTENDLGIPMLREDMLLESLPPNMKTWGDRINTPDNGESHYLISYGASVSKGCPFDRSIMCWYSSDSKIETWWNAPAYYIGQMLNAKLMGAVVPDFSIWFEHTQKGELIDHPPVLQAYSVYRAQWMGRFFQEVGIKVIPRLEYFAPCDCLEVYDHGHEFPCPKSYSMIGVPKNPPVLAVQLHTALTDYDGTAACIQEAFTAGWKPKQLLVYAGVKGKALIESMDLDCEVIILPTAKLVRDQGRSKEDDPILKELRKRKKGFERGNTTGGNR